MKPVSDYMTSEIVTVDGGSSIGDVVKLMKRKGIGSVLVEEQDRIIGIFTERDLVNRVDFSDPDKLREIKIRDVMTKDIKTVDADDAYSLVIDLMQKYNIRHMPIAQRGNIIGIVSLRDLLYQQQVYLMEQLQLKEQQVRENMKKVEESEEKLRTIFDNSAVAITVVDKNERIAAWNPFTAKLLGMDDDNLRGKPVKELYPPEDWRRIREENIRKLGMKHHLETRILNSRGETIDVDVSINVLKDANGNVVGSIGVMNDITERKKMERLREEFVGVASHELRTPLVSIREGVSQVLEGIFGEMNKDQREFLSMALTEIDRLKRIINDLLDIFKLESGRMRLKRENVKLKDVVKGVVYTFTPRASAKKLQLTSKFSNEDAVIYADRDRIVQILANLVGNAIKFTERGSVKITVKDKKNEIEFTVSDTGKGIAEQDVGKLFKKFQQIETRRPSPDEAGTGLGLAICKDIVELHKGRIWMESDLGKGSRFVFTLPKYTPEELFKECVRVGVNEAVEEGMCFSMLIFSFDNLKVLERHVGSAAAVDIEGNLEALMRHYLGYMSDKAAILKNSHSSFAILLPGVVKEAALLTGEKIKTAINDFLAKKELDNKINADFLAVCYPNDGKTAGALLKKTGDF